MNDHADDRKVKDLLRAGELAVPSTVGLELGTRLMKRMWRRPAGAGPRIFAKMGMDDPFARPGEMVDPHKAVYVAGRFVRLDKADAEKSPLAAIEGIKKAAAAQAPASMAPQTASTGDRMAERQRKLIELREAMKQKKEADVSPTGPVYAAGRQPPKPKGPPKQIAPEDRAIPKIPPPNAARASQSGRISSGGPPARPRVVQGGAPPGGAMPPVKPPAPETGPFAAQERKEAIFRTPDQKATPAPQTPARPAVAGTSRPDGVPSPKPPAPVQKPAPSPQKPATQPSAAPQRPSAPQVPSAPAAKPPAPPAAAPAKPQAASPTPKPTAPPPKPAPAKPQDDAISPIPLAKAPPAAPMVGNAVVKKARPAPMIEEPPAPPKAPPKVDRTPKKADMGLDDIFGGAPEGRVRIGKRAKKEGEGG